MSNLVSYDLDVVETDIMQLSLFEACEKYKNWAQYEGGAWIFYHITRSIAMREIVIAKYPKEDPPSFASSDEILKEFNRQYEMFDTIDRMYADKSESVSWKLGDSLQYDCFRYGLSPQLREFVVKHHASNWTTAQVIDLVLKPEVVGTELTPFTFYAKYYGLRQRCRDYLSPQLNNLKKGNPRFPKKYEALWNETRAAYIMDIQDQPMIYPSERVAVLREHLDKLRDKYDALPLDHEHSRDYLNLTRAITLTTREIEALTGNLVLPMPMARTLNSGETAEALPPPSDSRETVKALPSPSDSENKAETSLPPSESEKKTE